MVALKVVDIKDFMGKFLAGEVFDNFLLVELDVVKEGAVHFSGRRNQAWYDQEEWEMLTEQEYLTWREQRPTAFALVKGKRTPLSMKGILMLSRENTARILERNGLSFSLDEVGGLFLNLRYDGKELQLVTGISLTGFTMDKSLEQQWDKDVQVFLKHYGIAVESC